MEKKAQEYVQSCGANLGHLGSYAGNIANFGGAIKPNEAAPVVLQMWWSKGKQVGLPSDNVYNDGALYSFGNVSLLFVQLKWPQRKTDASS
ncbi:hypothetical protein OESDEN_24310 [Oesophagostomum dentatum]|uniref:SCP domain-containing protein n=1 Tax=Oesophagostomum dentatum TaxID=61180 RepID=A0A0B1RWR1_OESDE|nr:hypothetical protein OESDEN_24310 [Oesophagostomum dentatum]